MPKSSYELWEERSKDYYMAENMHICIKSMKKLISESKQNEHISRPTQSIVNRRSTILDIARKKTKISKNRESITMNIPIDKQKNKKSFSEIDNIYKNLLKKTIFEGIKLEDLDAPWNYFTEGVFHYNVGNILKNGDYFGELGLLTKKPRKATVLCVEDCYLIYLEKIDYKNVVQSVDLLKMSRKIGFFERYFLKGSFFNVFIYINIYRIHTGFYIEIKLFL